jgi:hypothetical protein
MIYSNQAQAARQFTQHDKIITPKLLTHEMFREKNLYAHYERLKALCHKYLVKVCLALTLKSQNSYTYAIFNFNISLRCGSRLL